MATKSKYGGQGCGAINCSNARWKAECKGMSFFRFPRDPERCRVWVQNTRRQDILGKTAEQLNKGGYVLCSKHFEPNQFNRPAERDRLTWNAVPTLFDVPNPPQKVTGKRGTPRERSAISSTTKKRRQQIKQEGMDAEPTTDVQNHPANGACGESSSSQTEVLNLFFVYLSLFVCMGMAVFVSYCITCV